MTNERLHEITQIIEQKIAPIYVDLEGNPNSLILEIVNAIAPLIEAAWVEGQKDMQVRSALIADNAHNDYNRRLTIINVTRAIARDIRNLSTDWVDKECDNANS